MKKRTYLDAAREMNRHVEQQDRKLYEQVQKGWEKKPGKLKPKALERYLPEGLEAPERRRAVEEAIILPRLRPVLLVENGSFRFDDTDAEHWRDLLEPARERLDAAIGAVGRIEVAGYPRLTYAGTGWLVAEDIVVTNRHVAVFFARNAAGRFVFRKGASGAPMTARVDFLEEYRRENQLEAEVTRILHLEPETGPDLALLRIRPPSGDSGLPSPIELSDASPADGDDVVVIGYPDDDPYFPDQALMREIFRNVFEKKRMAPGKVAAVRRNQVAHDCATLPGNSGSPLVRVGDGRVVGVHYQGILEVENHAVPTDRVREVLDEVRRGGRRRRARRPAVTPPRKPHLSGTGSRPETQSCGASWTIPLHVSVNLGAPGAGTGRFSLGGPGEPWNAPLPDGSDEGAVLAHARQLLGQRPDVVRVRMGWRFREGRITDERVVVAAVREKLSRSELWEQSIPPIPQQLGAFGVDVRSATMRDLMELTYPDFSIREAIRPGNYEPPENFSLREFDDDMFVVCHVSPDRGWPELHDFLGRTRERLTIGMYELTAPHVVDRLREVLDPDNRELTLTIQGGQSSIGSGTKVDDLSEEDVVVPDLRDLLGDRFEYEWVPIGSSRGLVPYSYHIKLAVRDGGAFWVSSGSWQSSNQPNADPVTDGDPTASYLRTYNREWHAIVVHDEMARLLERFLEWDLEQSRLLQGDVEAPVFFVESAVREQPRLEHFVPAVYVPSLEISRRVRVRPILTPDGYHEWVLPFIRSAQETVYFQNQSLKMANTNLPHFEELLGALLEKQQAGLDVRIIMRGDWVDAEDLEDLKDFGFDMDGIRFQSRCHNKGIVVDSEAVLLGSHNWTNSGTSYNRDASLLFFDDEIARYYEEIFLFDWEHMTRASVSPESPRVELAVPGQPTPDGFVRVRWGEEID